MLDRSVDNLIEKSSDTHSHVVCKQGCYRPHDQDRQRERDCTAHTAGQRLVEIDVILLGEKIYMDSRRADDETERQDLGEMRTWVDTTRVPLTPENKKEKKNV